MRGPPLPLRQLSDSCASAVHARTWGLPCQSGSEYYIETLPAVRTCRLDSFQHDRKYFLGVPTSPPIYCVMYETLRGKAASTQHKRGMLCDNCSIARGPLLLGIGNRRTLLLKRQADLHAFMIRVNTPSHLLPQPHNSPCPRRGVNKYQVAEKKRAAKKLVQWATDTPL